MPRPMLLLAALLLLAAAPLHAACTGTDLIAALPPAERAGLEAEAARQPFAQGNFWRATRGTRQVVVAGTYHLDDPRHAASMQRLSPLIRDASALLVEASPEEEARLKDAIARDPKLMLSSGPTLPERLSASEWADLSAALRARGIPAFMAARFAPWYVSVTLALPPCAIDQARAPNGLDRRAIEAAQAAGVPIVSLEPWDTVLKLFGAMTEEQQIGMIRTTLPLEPRAADMSVTLADRYFAGESRLVWEYMQLESQRLPGQTPEAAEAEFHQMEEMIILSRNRAWVPAIEAASAKGPVVVAVGALHLPGPEGVLALLNRAGFRIEPLTP